MLRGWGPLGAGGSSWPLPAPTPWEVAGFQWQGGNASLGGTIASLGGTIASLGGTIASLGSSPHRRPELQTIRPATDLAEPANGTAEPRASGRHRGRIGAVPGLQCWVPSGGPACPCHGSSPLEEWQKRARGHTRGTAPSHGGSTSHPKPSPVPSTVPRSRLPSPRTETGAAHSHRGRPPGTAAGRHESPAKATAVLGRGTSDLARRLKPFSSLVLPPKFSAPGRQRRPHLPSRSLTAREDFPAAARKRAAATQGSGAIYT